MVRQIADLETNIVSVERIKEYSEVAQEVLLSACISLSLKHMHAYQHYP